MSEAIYRLRGLTLRYAGARAGGPSVVQGVDLDVARGEQIALVGPSGAGKTTLLTALALGHRPHAGELTLFGIDPWQLSSAERQRLRGRLFLVPQAPPLPPRQRVVTAVLAGRLPQWSLWQALASLVYPRQAQLAYDALAPFALQEKLFMRVDRLSGGERQRVSLARMLTTDAEVMLVDEPLAALDPRLARQTLASLQAEAARRHAALICSLHQIELAHAEFARIVGLRDGQVRFDCPREQVTQEMLAQLYAGAEESSPDPAPGDGASPLVVADARCH